MRSIQQTQKTGAAQGGPGIGVAKPAAQTPVQTSAQPAGSARQPAPAPGSGAGLDWSIVSKTGETRQEHVRKHERDDTSKEKHGVFFHDSVTTINDAWAKRGGVTPTPQQGTDLYEIPYPRAGWYGGRKGDGKTLNTVRIVTKAKTNKIITGFPTEP